VNNQGLPGDLPAVFPDWSPYPDLESAAGAYLRDPDLALDALGGVLAGARVLCFTLERFVNDTNGVWQEVAACDGTRLVLWHGEDVAPGDGPAGSVTSSGASSLFSSRSRSWACPPSWSACCRISLRSASRRRSSW